MFSRVWTQVLIALPMVCACGLARAQTTPTPFEPAAVMDSLRPAARAVLTHAVHVDELPRYELGIALDDGNHSFALHEELYFTNPEHAPLHDVVLRVYGNVTPTAATSVPVSFTSGHCIGSACTVASQGPSTIVVHLAAPLAPGAHVYIAMDLHGVLPEIDANRTNLLTQGMESMSAMAGGATGGDYGVLSTSNGLASLAGFYPVLARRHGIRWEYTDASTMGDLGSDDLANVHAVITTAPGVRVAATGLTTHQSTTLPTGGVPSRQQVEVSAAAVREFALEAGPSLDVDERHEGDVTVRSWFLPADRAAGERVLDAGVGALHVYTQRFGAYPYTELDLVEAPLVGGAGGVEFPGMVTVASMFYHDVGGGEGGAGGAGGLLAMLGGAGATNALSQMVPAMLEFVTAHEVAHQYWHALVGSDSREHPFIDESLAQWSAGLYLEDRYGAERAHHDADMQVRMNYQFMRMMGQADGAVDRPAAAFATSTAYAGLVYGKGPYLYNALRTALGDAVFFRGVRRYVDTWSFREAGPTGFIDAMVAEAPAQGVRIHALAHRWLHEQHGDDDLGQANLASMMTELLGPQGSSPEVMNLLQQLAPMLGGGQPGAAPGGAAPGGIDPGALQQLLEQGLQGLGQ